MKYLEVKTYHNATIVSTADLKTHLRITFSDDDAYIASLGKAAVNMIEEYCNIYLNPTVVVQYGNRFSDLTILYKSPNTSVSPIVKYVATGGVLTTLASSEYEFVYLIKPARLYPDQGLSLPSTEDVFQAWQIEYTPGYATTGDIPEALIQAIKITVADMYENRQSVIVGKIVSEIPKTAQYLMNPYKIQTL
tara:strand:+ start:1061 stop:1636 length:576 start_codon:yes stop_codon:yes gene_type:complete